MVPLLEARVITNQDKTHLFADLELLIGVNKALLQQLENRIKIWNFDTCLGDIFLKMVWTASIYIYVVLL